MPFKSNAQRKKFGELVKQGKLSQKEFDKWNSETKGNLPERIGKPEAKTAKKAKTPLRRKFKY